MLGGGSWRVGLGELAEGLWEPTAGLWGAIEAGQDREVGLPKRPGPAGFEELGDQVADHGADQGAELR